MNRGDEYVVYFELILKKLVTLHNQKKNVV